MKLTNYKTLTDSADTVSTTTVVYSDNQTEEKIMLCVWGREEEEALYNLKILLKRHDERIKRNLKQKENTRKGSIIYIIHDDAN